MRFYKIKSHAKINVSIGVLGKLKSNLHKIESLIFFLDLHDDISIKKIKKKSHKIIFIGNFSRRIPKHNTVSNLFKILDNMKKLKNQKYLIKINKKIPQKSGMGGGSMNAGSILNYLIKKENLKLTSKEVLNIASKVGSDVILGLNHKNFIIYRNGKITKIYKKLHFYTLLVKPIFSCSTKDIYKKVKTFSKPIFKKKQRINLNYNFLVKLRNDLEKPAFKKYPKLLKLKKFIEKMSDVLFVRMTGSGSTIIGYFISKKTAINASKILKKKYKNYWCIISKTI